MTKPGRLCPLFRKKIAAAFYLCADDRQGRGKTAKPIFLVGTGERTADQVHHTSP